MTTLTIPPEGIPTHLLSSPDTPNGQGVEPCPRLTDTTVVGEVRVFSSRGRSK